MRSQNTDFWEHNTEAMVSAVHKAMDTPKSDVKRLRNVCYQLPRYIRDVCFTGYKWDYMFDWIVQKMEPETATAEAEKDSQKPQLRMGGRLCLGVSFRRVQG